MSAMFGCGALLGPASLKSCLSLTCCKNRLLRLLIADWVVPPPGVTLKDPNQSYLFASA
jgi:hypothetical protein